MGQGREHGEDIGFGQLRMGRKGVDGHARGGRVAHTGEVGGQNGKRLRTLSDVFRQLREHRATGGKLSVERQQKAALKQSFDIAWFCRQQSTVDGNGFGAHGGVVAGALLVETPEVLVRRSAFRGEANRRLKVCLGRIEGALLGGNDAREVAQHRIGRMRFQGRFDEAAGPTEIAAFE